MEAMEGTKGVSSYECGEFPTGAGLRLPHKRPGGELLVLRDFGGFVEDHGQPDTCLGDALFRDGRGGILIFFGDHEMHL